MIYLKKLDINNLDPFNEEDWGDEKINSTLKPHSILLLKNIYNFICINNNNIFIDNININESEHILKLNHIDEFRIHFHLSKQLNDDEKSIQIIIKKQNITIYLIPFLTYNNKYGVIVLFKIKKNDIKFNDYIIITNKKMIHLIKTILNGFNFFKKLDKIKYFKKKKYIYNKYITTLYRINYLYTIFNNE